MTYKTGNTKCCEPGCTASIPAHYWGHVKNDSWFHSKKEGKSYCPLHLPAWVPAWRSQKAEEKAEEARRGDQ